MGGLEDEAPSGTIDCPKCHATMKRVTVGDVVVDRCQACGGLWLDVLEKEKLLAVKGAARKADAGPRAAAPRLDKTTKGKCPRDKSTLIHMVDLKQPHVGYESCTVCGGVFMDAGELTDLSEMTLREWLRTVVR